MDIIKDSQKALDYHQSSEKGNGKIEIIPKVSVKSEDELALAYTPGVAVPCTEIHKAPEKIFEYTAKGNTVFIVSDGSAVLGLGNIGGAASLPVMEGKALLFKIFGGIDAYPIILNTQDPGKIIETVGLISTGAGGINLEDISAPRCFTIEKELKANLDIPVFHDDQHGTAVVTAAGLINSLKLTGRDLETVRIIINGSGAAGIAIARLLTVMGAENIIICDTAGAIYKGRSGNMNPVKDEIAALTNPEKNRGPLEKVIAGAEIFIGVSSAGVLTGNMIKSMAKDPVVFALANPEPEILPDEAVNAGVRIIATGRSDYPNQVNNSLAFPGIFRGLLDVRASNVTMEMKSAAAHALAGCIKDNEINEDRIIPSMYNNEVHARIAEAVARQAVAGGEAGLNIEAGRVYSGTLELLAKNRDKYFSKNHKL